jgi:hypothetical protein
MNEAASVYWPPHAAGRLSSTLGREPLSFWAQLRRIRR